MLTEILVPTALFFSVAFAIVGVTKIVADWQIRRQLVQRAASAELARAVTAPARPDLHGALRWAFVIGAVGLALVVVQFLPYRPTDPIVYGTILLFAAGGLFAYSAVGKRITPPAHASPAV